MRKSVHGSKVPGPRKRVIRSAHSGVVLIPPDVAHNHPTWRARYVDPDSGRSTKERLDPLALRTAEARRDWAIRKARALAKRAMEIEGGAPRATGGALSAGIDRYFKAHAQLRPNTLASYKSATDKLLEWAAENGVKSGDDLTRAKLLGFREEIIAEPKRAAAKKAKRGARRATAARRSAYSVNRELRGIRVVLGYLAELDLLTRIHEGDLRRALKKLPVTVERTEYLKPADLQATLDSALRHDVEMHAATRAELAGLRPIGTTPRFEAVAPFVATVLLTGMRLGEAIDLKWEQVDVDAIDNDGKVVGEIHLTGSTKTKRARSIDLEVSPALRELLAALKKAGTGTGKVFAITHDGAAAAAKRLKAEYGAPSLFGWQVLRRTCGTFLTNSPGIFGSASAYRSAKQLGHSVAVAEKYYVGIERGIPRDARDLETAMQINELIERVIAAVTPKPPWHAPLDAGSNISQY